MIIVSAAYVVGSIPCGVLVAQRAAGIDITSRGSGNPGATNVARELGLRWGVVTLVLDLLKGFIPVYLSMSFCPDRDITPLLVGFAALIGHQYSVFQGFKGGKGVSTALGVFLALSPEIAGIALVLFVTTVWFSGLVSLGSLVSAVAAPVLMSLLHRHENLIVFSVVTAVMIVHRHRENIGRILRGEERRFRRGGS